MTPLDDAGNGPGKQTAPLVGARPALILAAVLLAGFAGIDLLHWRRAASSVPLETVVQQPVPADNAPADTRSDAPPFDPGDNP